MQFRGANSKPGYLDMHKLLIPDIAEYVNGKNSADKNSDRRYNTA